MALADAEDGYAIPQAVQELLGIQEFHAQSVSGAHLALGHVQRAIRA